MSDGNTLFQSCSKFRAKRSKIFRVKSILKRVFSKGTISCFKKLVRTVASKSSVTPQPTILINWSFRAFRGAVDMMGGGAQTLDSSVRFYHRQKAPVKSRSNQSECCAGKIFPVIGQPHFSQPSSGLLRGTVPPLFQKCKNNVPQLRFVDSTR